MGEVPLRRSLARSRCGACTYMLKGEMPECVYPGSARQRVRDPSAGSKGTYGGTVMRRPK